MFLTDPDRRGTTILAAVLVIVFLVEVAAGAAGSEAALLPFGALRTRGWTPADAWRIATFGFLHLNWAHLVMNVAGLLWLGGIVERRAGMVGAAIIYGCAIAGSGIAGMLLGPYLPTTGIAVGASGGIFGWLAAALLMVFAAGASASDRRLRLPLLLLLVAAVATSFASGVSLTGHLGGLLGGAIATWRVYNAGPASGFRLPASAQDGMEQPRTR